MGKNRKRRYENRELDPGDVLLDAHNLPHWEAERGEGRLTVPIGGRVFLGTAVFVVGVLTLFAARVFQLALLEGGSFHAYAEENRLAETLVLAERGAITDRYGKLLAWNEVPQDMMQEFSHRAYVPEPGFGHVLGFVSLPKKDASGVLYQSAIMGREGAELLFDERLRGREGRKLVEVNALMQVQSESTYEPPESGDAIVLSLDARLQRILFQKLGEHVERIPFQGGAALVMKIETGELLSLVSYPEFSPHAMSEGDAEVIASYQEDKRSPFLNRALAGLYAPGSIVKPFVALKALETGVVEPRDTFVSTGALRVENPYAPGTYSVFRDWKAHGEVDMRRALAVSSNVYFFIVGGGFGERRGIGIAGIEEVLRRFGFGAPTTERMPDKAGVVPSPEWKARTFEDGLWRLGDTYNSAIGQFGTLVTPVQVVRAVAALASGMLVEPTLLKGDPVRVREVSGFVPEQVAVIHDAMRYATEPGHTAQALRLPFVSVAAKTGTAETGPGNTLVHSWVIGFWPYEKPTYAFAMVLESGPRANLYGAPGVMRAVLEELHEVAPEYFVGAE